MSCDLIVTGHFNLKTMKIEYRIFGITPKDETFFQATLSTEEKLFTNSFDTMQTTLNFMNENPDTLIENIEYTILPIITK